MDIKGNYKLKKAFVGFDDEFNMKFMSAKEILALDKNQDDDMVIIGMIFARMTAEITDNELIFRLNPKCDPIAELLAKANGMIPNDGEFCTIKYTIKKNGKEYNIVSEDGEEEGEITFKGNTFEFNYSTFEKI